MSEALPALHIVMGIPKREGVDSEIGTLGAGTHVCALRPNGGACGPGTCMCMCMSCGLRLGTLGGRVNTGLGRLGAGIERWPLQIFMTRHSLYHNERGSVRL